MGGRWRLGPFVFPFVSALCRCTVMNGSDETAWIASMFLHLPLPTGLWGPPLQRPQLHSGGLPNTQG